MAHKCCLMLRFILLILVFALASPPHLLAQSNKPTAQVKTSLHLRWPGQQGVLRYRLQLAHDEQFQDIVFDRAVFGTEYVVTELGAGRYFWRVAPAVKETGTFSAPRPVEIVEDARTDPGAVVTATPILPTGNAGWRTTTGSITRPLVAHLRSATSFDLVGVNSDGMVYGLDGATGVALWAARFRPGAKRGEPTGNSGAPVFTPVLIDGRGGLSNVVGAFEGGVRALDGGTGRELWRATLRERPTYGAVAMAEGGGAKTLLIASDSSPSLTVINTENGQILSEKKLDAPVIASPTAFPLNNGSGVALALDGGILDVRNSSGERVRFVKLDTAITTPPLVVSAPRAVIILIGTESGLISMTAEDLKPIGRIATEGDAPTGTLTSADLDADGAPEVLMLTRRARLVAVGTSDGKIKWYTSGATDAASSAFADLNNDGVLDVLVPAGQDFARGFSGRDGSLLWKAEEAYKGAAPAGGGSNKSRALVTGAFGDGSNVFVVGTDTAGTGLRAVGLPKDSVKAAKE
ncbi:MAG: outer membrane protein assembly factor BamB [Acidobacteriota bacterium]|nr:outer membrane protein assembly factor BamB [Acidobacteriota bacterium]